MNEIEEAEVEEMSQRKSHYVHKLLSSYHSWFLHIERANQTAHYVRSPTITDHRAAEIKYVPHPDHRYCLDRKM